MDAAMAALCDPSQPEAFDGLVKQLMSPSNEERRHAEGLFAEMRKHADPTALQLVRVIRTSPAAESRGMCAVLLRKVRDAKWNRTREKRRKSGEWIDLTRKDAGKHVWDSTGAGDHQR